MYKPLFLILLIFATYLIFQPRIPNFLFKPARLNYFDKLIVNTTNKNHLDPQLYWETREFYYPGVFYVFEDGLTQDHIKSFSSQNQITIRDTNSFPILVYNSAKWSSYEALVTTDKIEELVEIKGSNLVYEDKQSKIYKDDNKTYIYFTKPYDELKVTNGFIYTKDKILKNYNYWFGVSVVTE